MTKRTFRALIESSKPGLVKANALTAVAGYFFAGANFTIPKLAGVVAGTTLLVAAGCSLNNYFDRKLDITMERTRSRPTASGALAPLVVLAYSGALSVIGLLILAVFTTVLCTVVGFTALISYAFIYTYLKRKTPLAVPFGTIPGAAGLVTGYLAAENLVVINILLLFLIMFFWQIAHFYAIGMRRKNDYRAAKIPTPAVVYKLSTVVLSIRISVILYTLCLMLVFLNYQWGILFALGSIAMGIWWFEASQKPTSKPEEWARQVFIRSLLVLPLTCGLLITSGLIRIIG